MKKVRLSRVSALHYTKLIFRFLLFLAFAVYYIISRIQDAASPVDRLKEHTFIWIIICTIFVIEMVLRFFPSKMESMGCQKQFARNYKPKTQEPVKLTSGKRTFAVFAAWIALNGVFGVLYFTHVIDEGILLLISLAYSVSDMICILFFCPFQTWFLKNKCCTTCRIYNWDYAMMFTPLIFINNNFCRLLVFCSLALLLRWEITVRKHPERFSEKSNDCLSCANCTEKLCHHKKQLQHFLKDNKDRLSLSGNAVMEHLKETLPRSTKKDTV